jgi:TonB family protein
VLTAVRRNWMAVIPESGRMGRRGLVQLQFSIDRQGRVPKLVIATPSGTEAFDRAAVAGVSASNPFPPLPPDFKGEQIRLQLSFAYNVPTR